VAYIERVLNENKQHVPYAAGVMKVSHRSELSKGSIAWWYSKESLISESFAERSSMMLDSFSGSISLSA
jgi:hypothetical protein